MKEKTKEKLWKMAAICWGLLQIGFTVGFFWVVVHFVRKWW